jgi:hypothetical protein
MELLLCKRKALSLRQGTTNGFLYSHLCDHIKSPSMVAVDRPFFARALQCTEDEVTERLLLENRSGRVRSVAEQLYNGGFVMDAGTLLISSQSFHRELLTLNDALAYAKRLFS